MTPAYALRRLLELEPLTTGEIVTYTGWPMRKARHAIECLLDAGLIQPIRVPGTSYRKYAVAD